MSEERDQKRLDLMFELMEEFKREGDRAAAVLAAAYLDHLLGDLIAAAMKVGSGEVEKLLLGRDTDPLGTFSARVKAIYCLGLLSKDEFRDLSLIGKIRNEFAHELTGLSFETQSIAHRCRELKGSQVGGQPSSARDCFSKAAIRLMVDIILRIKEKRGQTDET